jgi:hypothetical protein
LTGDGDFRGEGDAVAEDRKSGAFHVGRGDVTAVVEVGVGFGHADQRDGAACAGTETDGAVGAGGAGKGDGVLDHGLHGVDCSSGGLSVENVLRGTDLSDMVRGESASGGFGADGANNGRLVSGIGIVDEDLQEETVELGFGEGIGAFLLDGILSGKGHEGRREGVGLTIDGDATFLHNLEESGLGLGGSAIDFVGEKELGEDRALTNAKLLSGEVEQGMAGDIGRHQVGSELNAPEGAAEGAGEGKNEMSFTEAGFAFEEDMATGKKSG